MSDQTTTQMMRAGLNLIGQALTIFDADLRLSVANRRYQEMFGLPDHIVEIGTDFADTIRYLASRGDYGEIADLEEFVVSRTEQARAFEPHYMERQRSNGQWISVEGSPLRTGGWVAVYTDITQIKQQESLLRSEGAKLEADLFNRSEELAETNRSLAATIATLEETKRDLTEAEARARMTSEMTPAHIAHVDRDQRYTYSNRKLSEVIGSQPRSIIGLTAREALGDEAYNQLKSKFESAFAGEPSVTEVDLQDATRRVRVALTPDVAPDGTNNGAYVLSMDITAEAQARAALTQTRKRELAAQLTSGLAHDFANLLTVILGLQSKLERIENLPDTAKDAIATTKAAALRGGELLDRLSDVSARRDLSISAVSIDTLFEDISNLAHAALPDTITFDTENQGIESAVMLDHGFVQDGLLNLVLNARDAIGEAGEIHLTARLRGTTWIEFIVTDTGSGFTNEALQSALDPFFTTKKDEGSGLGLTMAYDFAQMSGGRVRIKNRPEVGAEVTIQLPLRFGTQTTDPGMVLLVEDREDLRLQTREMLREMGHSVIEADNAEEALTLAQIPGVSHVLTDIMLGDGMNGFEMAQELLTAGHNMPVIMMTGLPVDDPIHQQASAQFPLLRKPFAGPQLAEKFHEVHA
ncbi:PAS-domain containing protein [Amylibacter sp. IMCC11727]|uniref:hybrid sensor histidine kinase/response regulator n=1 Tax=Amylibacter sp. IMCC11727 TaxID=3039851 RepID=UPI00244E1ABC|nr:PAS-domain containing protein [Amylibacter sp. IMCC11727]WGI22617.1 PAS-domain containing protein [Amylibacter sp. IMCC11727]